MRVLAVILGAGGVALLATVFFLTDRAEMTGDPLNVLGQLFLDADPIAKLVLLMLSAGVVVIAVVGAAGIVRRTGASSEPLKVLSYVCPLGGLAAAGYVAYITLSIATRLHVTNLAVIAPSLAEAALTAAVGLLAGALAAGLNAARAAT